MILRTPMVQICAVAACAAFGASSGGARAGAWSASPMQKVRPDSSGGGGAPAISLVGCRNGCFSWQLVVPGGAGRVRATASDLAGPGGAKIPASAVQIRYAKLDGPDKFYDGLESDPAAAATGGAGHGVVWVTVRVPADAKPGDYKGTVSLSGAASLRVPLKVSVADWKLPDPREFSTFLDLVQSPESVALQYKVPMWSDRHWKLIERSFELMGELGVKVIYIPMLRRDDFGNDYSMVYWTKGLGGKLTPDLTAAERYLDLAVKHLGKVPVVCLYAWHSETGGAYFGGAKYTNVEVSGMPVSVKENGDGKFSEGTGPKWGTPEVRKFWKPAFDGLKAALAKRGLEKSMMVGISTDMRPCKAAVEDLKAIAPEARWAVACHPYTTEVHGVPVGYLAYVWGITVTPTPGVKPKWGKDRAYGWNNPRMESCFPRYGCSVVGHSLRQWTALPAYRTVMEAAVTSPGKITRHKSGTFGKGLYGEGLRGVGRIGADFWDVLVDKRGRRGGPIHVRYIKKGDHAVNMKYSVYNLLQPGKDGAVGSARMENLREGIQEAEARVFIEKALLDPARKARLGGALAKKCQDVLDERIRELIKARSGAKGGKSSDPGWKEFREGAWQDRSRKLFEAAGEVAARLGVR